MNFLDDWRNTGQETYLTGATLFFKKYEPYREGWDHDHCAFCWAKFSTLIPDCLMEGYVTEADDHWICPKCFDDFKEHFKWNLL